MRSENKVKSTAESRLGRLPTHQSATDEADGPSGQQCLHLETMDSKTIWSQRQQHWMRGDTFSSFTSLCCPQPSELDEVEIHFGVLLHGISHNNDVWPVIDDFNNLGRYRICKLSGVYWTLLEHTPDSRYRDCDVLSYNIIEYKSSFSQPLAARMFLISSVRTSCLLSPHLAF